MTDTASFWSQEVHSALIGRVQLPRAVLALGVSARNISLAVLSNGSRALQVSPHLSEWTLPDDVTTPRHSCVYTRISARHAIQSWLTESVKAHHTIALPAWYICSFISLPFFQLMSFTRQLQPTFQILQSVNNKRAHGLELWRDVLPFRWTNRPAKCNLPV